VLRAADTLRYRDYLTVVLVVNRDMVFPDNWLYIHAPEVKMGRIQNYKNWSPEMVPDPSRTSLGLEYFLWDQDQEWDWPTDRLVNLGMDECQQLGLVESHEVEDGTVVRMRKAYPVYDQQYHASLDTVRRYLEHFSNLQTIGRNGLHRYNNQDHSMLTGIYAARNITGEQHDVWSVNTEETYHEEERVSEAVPAARLVPTRLAAAPEATEPERMPEAIIDVAFAKFEPVAMGVAVGVVAGCGLFLATALLLLQGGPVVGPTLSLLSHYLIGFQASWTGAFLGLAEAAAGGFILGYSGAGLRNWGMSAYAYLVRRRAATHAQRRLLDHV
jgi:hypothetical protein